MQKDILENYQKLTQLTLDNYKKLGEANLALGEKLLQQQAELTNALLTTTAKAPTDAKDLRDVATWQAEWAQEATKKVVEASRNCADIVAEAGKVYTNLFEATLKSAGCTAGASCSTEGKAGKKAA